MTTTGWGYFMQGNQEQMEVDAMGSQLSIEIHCPVHYPAFGKRLFECRCGVIFPAYLVRTGNWDMIRKKHTEEGVYAGR